MEFVGFAFTFYQFCWRLGAWRPCSRVWMAQVGPVGIVASLQTVQ